MASMARCRTPQKGSALRERADGACRALAPSPCPLPRWGRGIQPRLLAVGAAAHWVGLPADEACAREHAGVDGGAGPLALEDGGDLAAQATARLGGHAR